MKKAIVDEKDPLVLHGQRGERGEKGVQGDASDVLSVLAAHLPIQLAKRYGEEMCFVKYHVSEDQSSVVRMSGGVQTLRNVSAYNEPTWHFDAQFVNKQGKHADSYRAWTLFGAEKHSVP